METQPHIQAPPARLERATYGFEGVVGKVQGRYRTNLVGYLHTFLSHKQHIMLLIASSGRSMAS